ncbi:NAD(P)-binding domain-containing protein [Streptomyces sp. NPDC052693]|uniref:NAD(P)-dependent oxidoreductase n=1 Tax=Streptomyces sp. NPDC052693 TaxID=3155814 RepID=UPI00341225F5
MEGFVGAGRMGRPMVRRLVTAGHRVRVYARGAETREALARDGADPVASPPPRRAELRSCSSACSPTPRYGRSAWTAGSSRLSPPDRCSPYTPPVTRARSGSWAGRGVDVVDVPVSGGPHDIRAGRLTVFAGGERPAVERVLPALDAYADTVLHVGGLGAGQSVKLVNNAVFAAQLGLLAQAVRLGELLGVEERVLLDALSRGSGASNAAVASAARGGVGGLAVSAGAFLRKDLAVVTDLAGELGLPLGPLGPAIRALWELLPTDGDSRLVRNGKSGPEVRQRYSR